MPTIYNNTVMIIGGGKLLLLNIIFFLSWFPAAVLYIGHFLGQVILCSGSDCDPLLMLTILLPLFPLIIIAGFVESIRLFIAWRKSTFDLDFKHLVKLIFLLLLNLVIFTTSVITGYLENR